MRSSVGLLGAIVLTGALAGACGSSTSSAPSTARTSAPPASRATTTVALARHPMLTSTAFGGDGAAIPRKYACTRLGGGNVSPPLAWSGFPTSGVTLVLVVHDPDAPIPGGFTHLVTTMPAGVTSVADGANAHGGPMQRWMGPCPPSGTHHYRFTLYAFPANVTLHEPLDKHAVDAVAARATASATLTGLFSAP